MTSPIPTFFFHVATLLGFQPHLKLQFDNYGEDRQGESEWESTRKVLWGMGRQRQQLPEEASSTNRGTFFFFSFFFQFSRLLFPDVPTTSLTFLGGQNVLSFLEKFHQWFLTFSVSYHRHPVDGRRHLIDVFVQHSSRIVEGIAKFCPLKPQRMCHKCPTTL